MCLETTTAEKQKRLRYNASSIPNSSLKKKKKKPEFIIMECCVRFEVLLTIIFSLLKDEIYVSEELHLILTVLE